MYLNKIDEANLTTIAEKILNHLKDDNVNNDDVLKNTQIPVGISNRHIHLSQRDMEQLFGLGYELTPLKELSQPGQYAAKEVVTIFGTKGCIENVRILGPIRDDTQIEISKTDSFQLGVKAPINESGNLNNAGSAYLIGPKGGVALTRNVIIAKRHIHMNSNDAKRLKVKNEQVVSIKTVGERSIIFGETVIRVSDNYQLECHLDTDESNAADLNPKSLVRLER